MILAQLPTVQPLEQPIPAENPPCAPPPPAAQPPKEIGGPQGPEPTRFGDWERNGRCIDF
ncbi:MAG: DUF1674 domain-containing protein [Nevskiaceae bacterium]|nr:DUF1674 domain-containing protein [Nevskiaceae bacterium]